MIKKRVRKENTVNIETIAEQNSSPQPSPINDLSPQNETTTETTDPEKTKLQKEIENIDQSHLVKVNVDDIGTNLAKREDIANKYLDTIAAVSANRVKKHFKNPVDVDFNPSRCKDFHDSGYCSWGDSCIYAHDRTDYKRGWELDKEWEEQQKEAKNKQINAFLSKQLGEDEKNKQKEENCLLCEKKAVDAVYTECDHLFCEKCVLSRYKLDQKCPECGKALKGVFVDAKLKKSQNR